MENGTRPCFSSPSTPPSGFARFAHTSDSSLFSLSFSPRLSPPAGVRHPFGGILSCPFRFTMYVNDLQGECFVFSRDIRFETGTLLAPRAMPLSRESLQFNEENYFVFIPPWRRAPQFSTAPALLLSRPVVSAARPPTLVSFHLLVCADLWKSLIPRCFDRFEMF